MKKFITVLSCVIIFAFSPFLAAEEKQDTAYWIDVRSSEEYASGHLEEASNIPHTEIAEKIASITSDKNAAIHVYCARGGRAGKAKAALEELGYTNVTNEGGYEEIKARRN